MSGCSHGKTFKEPCTECQLVLAREALAWALQSVEKYSKLIATLAPDVSGPWIERGTGWAKVHNLPPMYLLDVPQGAWWSPEELQRAKSALSNIAITHGYKLSDVELSEGVRAVARALAVTRPHGGGQ